MDEELNFDDIHKEPSSIKTDEVSLGDMDITVDDIDLGTDDEI